VYSLPQLYGDFAITGLTTTDNYIKNNGDIVQRVVNAIQKAETYIHTNPSQALEIAVKRFPEVKKEIAAKALERAIQENIIPKSASISDDAWQKAIQLRLEVGDLKNINEMGSYVNNTFAKKAITAK
jgi:NitT/TauT family transport system substrate-binding protein